MSLAATIRGTAARGAKRCGGGNQATVKRSSRGLVSAATGAPLTSLVVNGTVAIGGTSLDLDAASIQPGGVLGQGWKFTLAGHTAPYEVQADVTASSNALASVTISPALSHEATNDATVTITQQYGEWAFNAWREDFDRTQPLADTVESSDYKLVLSLLGEPFTDLNSLGDRDTLTWDGKVRTIVDVSPIEPGTDPAVLRVTCRG